LCISPSQHLSIVVQLHLDITHQCRQTVVMRTTVDIDEDILAVAKDLARAEGRTMGQVISDLARRALTHPSLSGGLDETQMAYSADEFPMFPKRVGQPVTNDLVRRLQDVADGEDAEVLDYQRHQPVMPHAKRGAADR
jgi:hypothetical protein